MEMRGSRIFVECLKRENVDTIFYYTGGSVICIFDDLYLFGDGIRCVQPRHEQAGTHAADAYARSTGKVGVVVVTSGPGATNTITGIATAYMDSVPLVVITGQVPTPYEGHDFSAHQQPHHCSHCDHDHVEHDHVEEKTQQKPQRDQRRSRNMGWG